MQPRPRDERPVVDPRPGSNKKIRIPKPNPGAGKKAPVKPLPVKPIKGPRDRAYPMPRVGQPVDDKIYRTMPITEKQLGAIKKMYGIK
jgi:hypothetical protein